MMFKLPRLFEHKVAEILIFDFALHLSYKDLPRNPVLQGEIQRVATNIASEAKSWASKPFVRGALITGPYIDYLLRENTEQSGEEFRALVSRSFIRLNENRSESILHLIVP